MCIKKNGAKLALQNQFYEQGSAKALEKLLGHHEIVS